VAHPVYDALSASASTPRGYRPADRALLTEAWSSPYLFPVSRSWRVLSRTDSVETALRESTSARAILLDGGAALALYRDFDWLEQRCSLSIFPATNSATPDQLTGWLLQATDVAWNDWNIVRLHGEISGEQTVPLAALEGTPWQVEATVPSCLAAWPRRDASDLLYVGCLREDAPRQVAAQQDAASSVGRTACPGEAWPFHLMERCTASQVAAWFHEPTFFFTTSRPNLLSEATIRYHLLEYPGRRCYVALCQDTPIAVGSVEWQPERRMVGVDFRCIPDSLRPAEIEPPAADLLLGAFLRIVERLYAPRAIVRESMPVDGEGNALFAAHGFIPRGKRLGHIYRHNRRHDVYVSARVPREGY
jgi:hypothetical protein